MKLIEIYADVAGDTHFRTGDIALALRDFAPPSKPIRVSAEMPATTGVFLAAPPGWDDAFHPTPRRQLAVTISGSAVITASDGETRTVAPGDVILLNDETGKGHRTLVQGDTEATFLLIGLADGEDGDGIPVGLDDGLDDGG